MGQGKKQKKLALVSVPSNQYYILNSIQLCLIYYPSNLLCANVTKESCVGELFCTRAVGLGTRGPVGAVRRPPGGTNASRIPTASPAPAPRASRRYSCALRRQTRSASALRRAGLTKEELTLIRAVSNCLYNRYCVFWEL